MRGLYTAGVLDAMIDHGFHPDVICGTSAGVTFGVNLPSNQRGRALRYNKQYVGDKRYISLHSWLTTGNMINAEFAYGELPRVLDPFDEEAFEHSGTKFYATLTNTRTGEAEYMLLEDCMRQMDVIRASASLPILSRKVRIGAEDYLDGGLSDNIPLHRCMDEGCEKIIVVLTRPAGYVKNEHISTLCRLWYPSDKGLHHTVSGRNGQYMRRLEEVNLLEREGKLFVFRPSEHLKIARLERKPERLQALYDLGQRDAEAGWGSLQKHLQSEA